MIPVCQHPGRRCSADSPRAYHYTDCYWPAKQCTSADSSRSVRLASHAGVAITQPARRTLQPLARSSASGHEVVITDRGVPCRPADGPEHHCRRWRRLYGRGSQTQRPGPWQPPDRAGGVGRASAALTLSGTVMRTILALSQCHWSTSMHSAILLKLLYRGARQTLRPNCGTDAMPGEAGVWLSLARCARRWPFLRSTSGTNAPTIARPEASWPGVLVSSDIADRVELVHQRAD